MRTDTEIKSAICARNDIAKGISDALFFIPMYLPLAISFALVAKSAGLSSSEVVFWSIFSFSGVSQIASVGVIIIGGTFFDAMAATFLVNVRHGFASMSLSGYMKNMKKGTLMLIGFVISTPMMGLIPAKARSGGPLKIYWLSAAYCQYIQWIVFTLLGVFLVQAIPYSWNNVFLSTIPAIFISLAMPLIMEVPLTGTFVALVASILGIGFCFIMDVQLSALLAAVIAATTGAIFGIGKKKDDENNRNYHRN